MTIEASYSADTIGTTWKSPASGLWVATEADTYVGMVERIDGRYFATDIAGNDLGNFVELADAQMSLDGFVGAFDASPRDIMLMKATIALTGVIALALALSVGLRWQ